MENNLYDKYINCKNYYRWEQNPPPDDYTKEKAYNFIKKYFEISGKEKVFDLNFLKQYQKNGKHIHTVSLFLLGINLKNIIKNLVDKYRPETFDYIWFLICLYHDVAIVEEDNTDCTNKYKNCLEYYLGDYNIKYDVFQHHWGKDKQFKYSENLVKNYFKYRLDNNKIDHGIIGGYLLFDRLRKNYDSKFKEKHNVQYDNFNTDNYHWEIKHHDYYAIAAHVIIEHNMWFAYNNEKKQYEKYGLSELIIQNDEKDRINILDNSLLFYFGLLDSIEPTKVFINNDANDILKKISIELNNECLSINFDKELIKKPEFERYINNIYDTKKWLNVKFGPKIENVQNSIKIFIKYQEDKNVIF